MPMYGAEGWKFKSPCQQSFFGFKKMTWVQVLRTFVKVKILSDICSLANIRVNVLRSAYTLAHLKKLQRQISRLNQKVTVQYGAINNHKPSVYDANSTHLGWTRANCNMSLFTG